MPDESTTPRGAVIVAGRKHVTGKALSVRQPWAWAIVEGLKPVENRKRRTTYRGALLDLRWPARRSTGLAIPGRDGYPAADRSADWRHRRRR